MPDIHLYREQLHVVDVLSTSPQGAVNEVGTWQ